MNGYLNKIVAAALGAVSVLCFTARDANADINPYYEHGYCAGANKSECKAKASWGTDEKVPSLRMIAEAEDDRCALECVVARDLTPTHELGRPEWLTFDFRKFERGTVFKETTDPMIRLEIFSERGSGSEYRYTTIMLKDCEVHDRGGGWKWVKVGLLKYLKPNDQITRIAVVGRRSGIMIKDYFDCEVSHLQLEGRPASRIDLTVDTSYWDATRNPDRMYYRIYTD